MSNSLIEADFIKDKPSPWLYRLFSQVILFLFKNQFNKVLIDNRLKISENESYLFLLNHHTWWDGILPMLLDVKAFKILDAKGIMDEEQLKKREFFSRFKVFSINRKSARKALKSIDYAKHHLKMNGACLFIFPQGAIFPNLPEYFKFELGYQRIAKSDNSIQLIPIVTYIEQFYDKKPSLWIKVAEPFNKHDSNDQIEEQFTEIWNQVKIDAFQQSNSYTSLV